MRGYADVAEIVLCHHERIDGRGYPRNLAGDDIPLLARVLSVADCFDVMTARDSYRTPMSIADAIAELRRVAGTQLDARFVEIFVGVIEGAGRGLPPRRRRGPRGRAAHGRSPRSAQRTSGSSPWSPAPEVSDASGGRRT